MSSMAIILLKVVPWPFPVSQGFHVYTAAFEQGEFKLGVYGSYT